MEELVKLARNTAKTKLAALGATRMGYSKKTYRKRKRKPKIPKATAVIMPEEATPDFWETPGGAYLRGGTLGAGTMASLGYALGGLHWSGKTKLFGKTKDIAKELRKKERLSPMKKAIGKARRGKIIRGISLGGALTGMGLTGVYRHKAKKRRAQLAKMPKRIVVPIVIPKSKMPKIKTSALKLKMPKPKKMKIETPVSPLKTAPGKTQAEQAIKITAAPISKVASDKAVDILSKLGSK